MHVRSNASMLKQKPMGLAVRVETYPHWRQVAERFEGLATNRCQIQTAIAYGTPDLSWPARSLLLLLVSHLSPEDIAQGKSSVWPSTAQIADAFDCSPRAVRSYKAELEAKGYLLRRYDRRNRPLRGAAFDLAPFLARLPDILATISAGASNRRRQRLLQQADRDAASSPIAAESCRLLNSQNQNPESATAAGQNDHALDAVLQVIEHSPKLRAALSPEALDCLARSEPERAFQDIARQVERLLSSDRSRRNNGATWNWAVRRHGIKALAMLAVAIEDPHVASPCRYFGRLATTPGPIDLTANIRRLQQQTASARADAPPVAMPDLYRLMEPNRYHAWFSRCQLSVRGHTAVLWAPSAFVADWIRNNFALELRLLAKSRRCAAILVEVARAAEAAPQIAP